MAYQRNNDFKKYYDTTLKRNIWVLGYFGGGSVNIVDAYQLALEYAKATNVPLESVHIDEILSSRRYKGFKIIFSTVEQEMESDCNFAIDKVYAWLRD